MPAKRKARSVHKRAGGGGIEDRSRFEFDDAALNSIADRVASRMKAPDPEHPIPVALLNQVADAVTNIRPDTFMSPGQPMKPMVKTDSEEQLRGRGLDGPVAFNIGTQIQEPTAVLSMDDLRSLAYNCWAIQGAIWTRQCQLGARKWGVRMRGAKTTDSQDSESARWENFLRYPDLDHTMRQWQRAIVNDWMTLGLSYIYREPSMEPSILNGTYALKYMDGATIKKIVDTEYRTPAPPSPAYYQKIHGAMAVRYTTENMICWEPNPSSNRIYAVGPTEQLATVIQLALSRDMVKMAEYTRGSMPQALLLAPKEWSGDDILAFGKKFRAMLQGSPEERAGIVMVPAIEGANSFIDLKGHILKDDFDEWLFRLVCWFFSLNPQTVVKVMNRATGEGISNEAEEEGIGPMADDWYDMMNFLTARHAAMPGHEWYYLDKRAADRLKSAQASELMLKRGTKVINEIRESEGDPPIEGGDVATIDTAAGLIPVSMLGQLTLPPAPGLPEPTTTPQPSKTPEESPAPAVDEKPGGPKQTGTEEAKVVQKRAKPKTYKTPKMGAIARDLTMKMTAHLSAAGKAIMPAVMKAYPSGRLDEATKAEGAKRELTEEEAAAIVEAADAFGWEVVVKDVEAALLELGEAQNMGVLGQLGVDSEDALNAANARAISYARERGAELVGMKRTPAGELVPNPRAEWQIDEVTRRGIQEGTSAAFEEGLTPDALGQRLERYFDEDRAETIARTELSMAQGAATEGAWKESGVVTGKYWLLSNDHIQSKNGNEDCELNAAQGTIPLTDTFQSGHPMTPGHPDCQCDVAAETKDGGEEVVEGEGE